MAPERNTDPEPEKQAEEQVAFILQEAAKVFTGMTWDWKEALPGIVDDIMRLAILEIPDDLALDGFTQKLRTYRKGKWHINVRDRLGTLYMEVFETDAEGKPIIERPLFALTIWLERNWPAELARVGKSAPQITELPEPGETGNGQ